MALMKCPECGGKVSSLAEACPHCGCPVEVVLKQAEFPPTTYGNTASLMDARIYHSIFGPGIVVETTKELITVQCGDKRYPLRPSAFIKFAKFIDSQNWPLFYQYFKVERANISLDSLEGVGIEHSIFGHGFVAKTTEDRIIIQCYGKQYQLQPKDFAKYAEFADKENWTIFRKKFAKELNPPESFPDTKRKDSLRSGYSPFDFDVYDYDMETDSGPDSIEDYYAEYHRDDGDCWWDD